MATAKHKIQDLVFNPAKLKLLELLGELQKLSKDAFGVAVQAIIEQFLYAKMPPHLKKLVNQGHLENSTFEQIVRHLEKELELNSLEAPDELQMNTMTQKQQTEGNKKILEVLTVTLTTITPKISKNTEPLKLSAYPVEYVETQTSPQRKVTIEPMQQTGHFPGRANRQYRTDLIYKRNRTI